MAFFKQSVASLTAFFEKGSQEDITQNQAGCQKKEDSESCICGKATARKFSTSIEPELHYQIDSLAHEFWKELLRHARESRLGDMDQVFSAVGEDLKKKMAMNVSEEVYTRELIATLETFCTSRGLHGRNGKKLLSEEQVTINALKRRLKDTSDQVQNAEKAEREAKKEIYELEYICEEHEEKHKKLSKSLKEIRSENQELKTSNTSILNKVQGLETDIERLRAARGMREVETLRAMHKAEMAELVAKQASLRCTMFHQQLREAEGSSHVIFEHVDELERVLNEMKTLLSTSTSHSSEDSNAPGLRNPLGYLVSKGSKILGRFRTSSSRRRDEIDTRSRQERISATDAHGEDEHLEESSTPKSGKKLSRGQSAGADNRNGHESQRGFFRKMTNRLRQEKRLGEERTCQTDARAKDEHMEPRGAPTSLADLKRIISLDSQPEYRSQLQSREPLAIGSLSKTVNSLEKNVTTLRDMIENKEEEIHTLRRELRAATKLSNAFEQGLRKESNKLTEMKKILEVKEKGFPESVKDTFSETLKEENGVCGMVNVQFSRRLVDRSMSIAHHHVAGGSFF
ncbi:unnamed protein product [Agarophyton chilense]